MLATERAWPVTVIVSINGETVVPPFDRGTTVSITIVATKDDQSQPMTVVFRVTATDGSISFCGGVF